MYTTVADLIAYAGIPSPTAADNTLITALIAAAQQYIDLYCHQTFEATVDGVRYFDAICDVENGRKLWLDYPLCAALSVQNGDGTTVAAASYVTEPRNQTPWYALTLKSNSGLTWTYTDTPEKAISVTGKWAYSLTPDANIVQVTKELTAYYWRQKDSTGDADRAVLVGNATVIPATIPMDILDKLKPYRRLVV